MKQQRRTGWFIVLFVGGFLVAGCGDSPSRHRAGSDTPVSDDLRLVERVLEGTVGFYARVEGGVPLEVQGYGLVVGLAGNGSSEAPKVVRDRLVKEMGRMGIGDVRTGTSSISPNKLIDDPDTAPVIVRAVVAPGAPKGVLLDVAVSALPKSQTRSLDGGMLYLTELRAHSFGSGSAKQSRGLVTAKGPIFVNPFGEGDDAMMIGRLRHGRVIGGGETVEARAIRLVLRQPDYRVADVLQKAINSQFPERRDVAVAKNPSAVEIRIPQDRNMTYTDFIQRVMHLYVRRGAGTAELKARTLAKLITEPNAPYEDISLIWEGLGAQVILPVVRKLYVSADPAIAFWAARAGARVGDASAIEALARLAEISPEYRIAAVGELGRTGSLAASPILNELLNDPDATVRIAVYEAMIAGGLAGNIARYDVDGNFELHVAPSKGRYLVYATRTGKPRIVLFGAGLGVNRPVFFSTPDDLVTINANAADATLSVYRRVGRRKRLSDALEVAPDVKSLVLAMGRDATQRPDRSFRGLGLSYSQVVGVLYRLCEGKLGKKVPADFILQKPDNIDRIGIRRAPVGRRDRAVKP